MMKTGLFVGTFDPFTVGHQSVVRRALCIFDRLVIGVGINTGKNPLLKPEERVQAISRLYDGDDRVQVVAYDGLTVDLAQECGAVAIVKGVRSAKDFEYEREQADINRLITHGEVETLLLLAEPQLASVSSSMVRELRHFGLDVSRFLP